MARPGIDAVPLQQPPIEGLHPAAHIPGKRMTPQFATAACAIRIFFGNVIGLSSRNDGAAPVFLIDTTGETP